MLGLGKLEYWQEQCLLTEFPRYLDSKRELSARYFLPSVPCHPFEVDSDQ